MGCEKIVDVQGGGGDGDEGGEQNSGLVNSSQAEPEDDTIQLWTFTQHRCPTPILDYFISIFGFEKSEDTGYFDPVRVYHDDEGNVNFAGPFERPKRYRFSKSQAKNGILATVSKVETPDRILIFDHAASWRLMELEASMNQFYGHYLMSKARQGREPEFEVVQGGYYAVFRDESNCWTRCYVNGFANPVRRFSSEQRIFATLFDYDSESRPFLRKQFLPLKKSFLKIPVQKLRAYVHLRTKAEFPWKTGNLTMIREFVVHNQFSGMVSNYILDDQPIPTLTIQLLK